MLFALFGVVSCGVEYDYAADQRTAIIKYLTSHSYSYDVVSEGSDSVFVYRVGNQLDTPPEVTAAVGDSVKMWFAAYTFDSSPQSTPFYTNRSELITGSVLNTAYWSFDVLGVRVGDGTLIHGVDMALSGCRTGDRLQVYVPCNVGYGAVDAGLVADNQALMFDIEIEEVKKQ